MYKLYYYPGNANTAPHMMLEEIGVDFKLLLVDRKSDAQKSADYLKLNPAGRIPTLVDGDLVLFESPAICVHLAEQHPNAHLIPALGTPQRAKFHQWMMYLTNTVQAELMVYFYPDKHTDDPDNAAPLKTAAERRVTDMFWLLDDELTQRPYLTGDAVTACDFFFMMLCIWADEFETPPHALPNLAAYLKRMASRPSVQAACKTEKLSLELYGQ
jgi:glutathione S-transferase